MASRISDVFRLFFAVLLTAAANGAAVVASSVKRPDQQLSRANGRPTDANAGFRRACDITGRRPCGGRPDDRGRPEIPLALILELNKVTEVSELFTKFVPHFHYNEALFKLKKTTNGTQVPKAANCAVEMHTVSLRDDDNPNLYYSPPCTRVKRCGGCCGSNLVSCQPTQVETINFEVTVLEYNNTFSFKEKKIIAVEQHVKCKCDCIVKENDCQPTQVYVANECRCVCNNDEAQDKCFEQQEIKIWDSETCSCRCMGDTDCTTGYKFNYETCQCEPT